MPLYEVECEVTLVVTAANESKAEEVARWSVREELSNASYWAAPLTKPVDSDWLDSVPYGAPKGDYRTVRALLDEEAARPPTVEEIEAAGQTRLLP